MNGLWPYPGLRGRIFLDYPLDILFNSECTLKSHESGLVRLLSAYKKAVDELDEAIAGAVAKVIEDNLDKVSPEKERNKVDQGQQKLKAASRDQALRNQENLKSFGWPGLLQKDWEDKSPNGVLEKAVEGLKEVFPKYMRCKESTELIPRAARHDLLFLYFFGRCKDDFDDYRKALPESCADLLRKVKHWPSAAQGRWQGAGLDDKIEKLLLAAEQKVLGRMEGEPRNQRDEARARWLLWEYFGRPTDDKRACVSKYLLTEDWSSMVKNWEAAANAEWAIAFGGEWPCRAFDAQASYLRQQVEGLGVNNQKRACILRVLQFHMLLRSRVLGALQLPSGGATSGPGAKPHKDPGSGNIVIEGTPGTGKSTLALQMALALTKWPNQYHAVYLSLEEPVDSLCAKARKLSRDWRRLLKPVIFLDDIEDGSSPQAIGERLRLALAQPAECPMRDLSSEACEKHQQEDPEPKVLLPCLSPRSVAPERAGGSGLVWERLQQLERLLAGAKWLREHSKDQPELPHIGMVCIDSLNTFGDRPLTRAELCRLFDLFREYQVIGLCTAEAGPETEEMASSDLVDILIRLEAVKDDGYFTRYFEIVKSRYQSQVYGRHPFKIRCEDDVKREAVHPSKPPVFTTLFQAVKIFPSVHTVVAATEQRGTRAGGSADAFDFGIEGLRHMLNPTLRRNSVLAIVGERNTYKTPLSQQFLLKGLLSRESVVLIRLHEQVSFHPTDKDREWRLSDDRFRDIHWPNFAPEPEGRWLESSKLVQQCYRYGKVGGPWLFELALKGGAILPEEFLQFVRNILRSEPAACPIKRVVLDNVALIGASYPLLRHSQNAGDLFLSTFVHVMRNCGVDLVMLGTRTGLVEADEMVNRACALADEVLTCEYCDVFGDRYITIHGGGLAAGRGDKGAERQREMVPAVIVPGRTFRVDLEKLEGLAGFGTSHIHRAGLSLLTFEENELHRKYNQDLEKLIGAALGVIPPLPTPGTDRYREQAGVEVIPFRPDDNQSFHDGLILMAGKPIDKTIVATVDEFFVQPDKSQEPTRVFAALGGKMKELPENQRKRVCSYLSNIEKHLEMSKTGVRPYYANVLLLAYDGALSKRPFKVPFASWSDLAKQMRGRKEPPARFGWDRTARETGACLLLDALIPKGQTDDLADYLKRSDYLRDAEAEVEALVELAQMDRGDSRPNAHVYACWYSQLRETIRPSAKAKSGLASNTKVCGLPGGGFTGDWYIGVIDGSVSVSLGQRLVDMLCQEKEEAKRLGCGVGLPTSEKFYTDKADFPLWPGASTYLSDVRSFHDNARSRSGIQDYQDIKPALYEAWSEMVDEGKAVRKVLKGLPKRIGILVTPKP